MSADRARLRRLQRLEQVRQIAKQQALREAAEAEGTLNQLEALAERTRHLADGYRSRTAASDAFELGQLHRFVAGLDTISAATCGDAAQARRHADSKHQALALAERSRAAADDRAAAARRMLDRRSQRQALGPRRKTGTPLE